MNAKHLQRSSLVCLPADALDLETQLTDSTRLRVCIKAILDALEANAPDSRRGR